MLKTNTIVGLIGLVLVLIGIISVARPTLTPEDPNQDVYIRDRVHREPPHFELDPQKFPTIGVSSEEDVYKLLGKDFDRRLTYKTVRQKTYNDTTFTYNRIILYESMSYRSYKEGGERKTVVNSPGPVEHSALIIYLLDGKVTYFSALHKIRPDLVLTDNSRNLHDGEEYWPDSSGDMRDYLEETDYIHIYK